VWGFPLSPAFLCIFTPPPFCAWVAAPAGEDVLILQLPTSEPNSDFQTLSLSYRLEQTTPQKAAFSRQTDACQTLRAAWHSRQLLRRRGRLRRRISTRIKIPAVLALNDRAASFGQRNRLVTFSVVMVNDVHRCLPLRNLTLSCPAMTAEVFPFFLPSMTHVSTTSFASFLRRSSVLASLTR